jgi:hypothetical protein
MHRDLRCIKTINSMFALGILIVLSRDVHAIDPVTAGAGVVTASVAAAKVQDVVDQARAAGEGPG